MTLERRLTWFLAAVFACLALDLAVTRIFATYDTGARSGQWWWLVPALVAGAVIVRPAWGCVIAGIAAGGVLGSAIDGNAVVSLGLAWNVAWLTGWFGLIGITLMLGAQAVRIFPNAKAELRSVHARRTLLGRLRDSVVASDT